MRPVLISILFLLMGAGFVFAGNLAGNYDDSTLFMAAFNARQQGDYLLTLETGDQLLHIFPDSPLRDVTLLLMVRASLQSGDNQLAARLFRTFISEFPERTGLAEPDPDLSALRLQLERGERLEPDRQRQARAAQVRSERLLREDAARAGILAVVRLSADNLVAAGTTALLPLEIANRGNTAETFLLELAAPPEYGASIPLPGTVGESFSQLQLNPGEVFSSAIAISMPADKVDGYRTAISVTATSAHHAEVAFRGRAIVTTSAPLVRVVTRLYRSNTDTAGRRQYHVTVLNIGSLAARDVQVRVQLPPELLFLDAQGETFQREPDGGVIFKRAEIASGRVAELDLEVQQQVISAGRALMGHVDISVRPLKSAQRFTTKVAASP